MNHSTERQGSLAFLTRRRGGKRFDITDLITYAYLLAGVIVMFGPILWLGMSSFKPLSGLYIRWAEVGCYSPLMRAHGGPIGRNREPWKFDEETVEIYRTLSEEHVKLFPYLYTLSREATRDGTPIIRHPALIWPDCAELYSIEDAWMMGEALYIAPVIQPGHTKREVILPPGEWWDLNECKPVHGPARITVDAPLGETPRFLRQSYLLPRFVKAFDTFDNVTTASAARLGHLDDDLEVWMYPGEGAASFTLFDGTALNSAQRPSSIGARRVTWRIFG